MIESFLTQNMITDGETAIGDYLRTGQSDFSKIWRESFRDMIQDFIDSGFTTRLLCKELSIQSSVIKTAAFTGDISSRDYAQRMRLVIPVTAITGNAVFTLQGTDDEGDNYYDIYLIGDDGTSATTKTISTAASGDSSNSYSITKPYKQYRLKLISIGTTVTYSAYMITEIYTLLHKDKTRANIYRTLSANNGDIYMGKYQQYMDSYKMRFDNGRFDLDADDDDSFEESEGMINVQKDIRFRP